jgi:2-polyprenyl-6-methoxyphenol hydroxylase-like FAD-dependent oxidoreductase
MRRHAVVVGAGIGGLAAARALRIAGLDITVLERSPDLRPEGAGITLWPNATRVLRDLDVTGLPDPRLVSNTALRRWDGRAISTVEVSKIEARFGGPMLFMRRTSLHQALLGGGIADLIRTGAEVVGVEEDRSGVRAQRRDGEMIEAELLVGADGIRSAVRGALLADGPPRPIGLVAYRALAEMPTFPFDIGDYWGPCGAFGLVPVEGDRLFWIATMRIDADQGRAETDPIAGLLERHREWFPTISRIIEGTRPEDVMRHEMFDRKPTRRWVGSRTALLGDAAHPMHPFLGQGACQALEDAEAIGQAVTAHADMPTALKSYERRRRRRAAKIANRSRHVGRAGHLRAAPARAVRDRLLSLPTERMMLRQLDRTVGRPRA